ncbi:hypothetical protein LP415_03420 [Polaromonas sp. P1(28)-8]|nr:hypothetical protein LP415_03420 [Polaromonas sp. P1(28)-8]
MLYKKVFSPAFSAAACAALSLSLLAPASAQNTSSNGNGSNGDNLILEMNKAFRRGDKGRLAQMLPQAKGHALEAWAAYWELKTRLGEASAAGGAGLSRPLRRNLPGRPPAQ